MAPLKNVRRSYHKLYTPAEHSGEKGESKISIPFASIDNEYSPTIFTWYTKAAAPFVQEMNRIVATLGPVCSKEMLSDSI